MPALLQSKNWVTGCQTIHAAFHLFKFLQKEIIGVYDFSLLSFNNIYMSHFNILCIKMHVTKCFFFLRSDKLLETLTQIYTKRWFRTVPDGMVNNRRRQISSIGVIFQSRYIKNPRDQGCSKEGYFQNFFVEIISHYGNWVLRWHTVSLYIAKFWSLLWKTKWILIKWTISEAKAVFLKTVH